MFPFFIFVIFIYTNIYVMTSKEFILWLKGFTEGVHEFNITPKQWDILKDKLAEVSDEEKIGTPIGVGGWGTPNGTGGSVFTTTPGTTGHITIANPQFTTSTAYGYPSGSTWSYTTYPPYTTQTDNDLKANKKFKKRKAKSVKEWEDEIDLGGEE